MTGGSAPSSTGGEQAGPSSAQASSVEASASSSSSHGDHATGEPRHVPAAASGVDEAGTAGHAVLLAPVGAGAHASGAAVAPAAEATGSGAAGDTVGAAPGKVTTSELSRALAALDMLIPEPPAPAGKDALAKSRP
ncbi:hypothetical protein TSOC_005465 [Tetrabaena socialis]|uniref:Uncharacterized protein n=1 Tax=Tetrabaena socialis TaxID=47790 RepID=A0A2J8A673_9CHLO|nr:hypothetical protein TSOC_005465 [Tetrabaena socialis]|eukprot:PNH08032.1 hypothetical protein TSOC_005465 [Tetrabaena socialis]